MTDVLRRGAAVRTLCLALFLTPSARGTVWHMLDEHQPSMPHFRGVIRRAGAGDHRRAEERA